MPDKKSVLVVDDDRAIGELFCEMLVFFGYEAKSCVSSKVALAIAGEKCFDAALVDYYLPETDGVRLSRALRVLCPGMVIIGMSGRSGGEGFATLPNSFFLAKPVKADRLASVLEQYLSGQE